MNLLAAPEGIGLVALDIDGTLVREGDRPSDAVIAGIYALRERGVKVVLATGRELHNTIELCRNIGAEEMWAVCSNGAVTAVVTPDRWEVLEQVTFDPRPALAALTATAPDLKFAIEDVGVGHVTSAPFAQTEFAGPRQLLDRQVPAAATLVITSSESATSSQMMAAIAELDVYGLPYDVRGSGLVDLSPAQVSKLTGVRSLAESWGLEAAACAAVGDYLNDIPLLEWAGWGVAMGHAPRVVRDAADAVAPNVVDDGLATVLAELAQRHGGLAQVRAKEPTLEEVVAASFEGASRDRAWEMLDEFGRGPWADAQGPVRLRFAVIRLAGGDTRELADAIKLAETDWRDVLMAAEFGDPDAHWAWAEALVGDSR